MLVAQLGARRNYAVPAILASAGLLERFYTDICADLGLGRVLALGRHLGGRGSPLARLAARRLPERIRGRTRTFATETLRHVWRRARLAHDPAAAFREHLRHSRALGQAMVREGYGAATHVYSMLGECGPFLVEARQRGLEVVSEVYIMLSAERIVAAERRAFPGWEDETPDYAAIRRAVGDEDALLTATNHFVCPSPAVRDDLVRRHGVALARTVVVPYGMDPRWLELPCRPVRGRVLFVGTAGLRKGIHYLALAAERLRASGHRYEFHIAGDVSPAIAAQPSCRHLTFLGRVPRRRIHEELACADLLVLPSLAEGSAEVTYEALAAGLPQVVTPAAGSVARHGLDGLVVPERDPEALAEAIASIVEDRALRARLSAAARDHAHGYTWARYGQRLVAALAGGEP